MRIEEAKMNSLKSYMRLVMRYAEVYNYYRDHFETDTSKKNQGKKFYFNKIKDVLESIDKHDEVEKDFFYQGLSRVKEEYMSQEKLKLRTLQFSYARFCREKYQAVETVLEINQIRKKENIMEL